MFRTFLTVFVAGLPLVSLAADKPNPAKHPPAVTDPTKADADFPLQGEYERQEETAKDGAQVIALGQGKFRLVVYSGGLPGDGYTKTENARHAVDGELKDGAIQFSIAQGRSAVVKEGVLIFTEAGHDMTFKHVMRKSPTEGLKPPEGAIVLFDGKNADEWTGGTGVEDGLLCQGPTSKRSFTNYTLHVEFMLPYEPTRRGQDRGNSGVYNQGRYEIQVLDSFGLEGKDNECGGIYEIKAPLVNMCYPPLSWQTYDIDFTAAQWDAQGKKTSPAKITLKQNGVLIHDGTEIPRGTRSAPVKVGPGPGPIYLQDHGHPVRFRNIWIVEK